jgi:hypothetical protein
MALRKTKVERIIDTVLSAAGLSEVETAKLLEEHWNDCNRRERAHGSPHRPEWEESKNSLRDGFTKGAAGIDPSDPSIQQQFGRLVEACKAPPSYSDWD